MVAHLSADRYLEHLGSRHLLDRRPRKLEEVFLPLLDLGVDLSHPLGLADTFHRPPRLLLHRHHRVVLGD